LRIDGSIRFLGCLCNLAPLPATGAAQAIECGVRRCAVQPGRSVLGTRGVQAVKVNEDLLRHVLCLMWVCEHSVGDARDTAVLGGEKGFE
jgi:hypothetical protein